MKKHDNQFKKRIMTHEQQSKLLGEFYAEKKNILKLKGEDYANEDVLSNFKSAGANIGISAELQCLSLIATKVARLGNLLSGKTPNNESVSDSILDLSNYTDLLYCLVNEQITDDVNKPKTERWENVKPKGIIQAMKDNQKSLLKEIMNDDEKDGLYEPKTKRWENVEPIKDTYEPKVGDRFENENGIIINLKRVYSDFLVFQYKQNGDLIIAVLWLNDFLNEIKLGKLKKVN